MSILGLEIGTTGCSAVIFARNGEILGRAQRTYPLLHPESGAMELDSDFVLARVRETVISAVDSAGDHDPITTLCAAVQGETVVPVDAMGHPLAPALTTFDSRPTPQAEILARDIGRERLFGITGLPLHPMSTLCKILWWKQRRPDLLAHTFQFLGFDALLLRALGLPALTDFSMAGRTMLLDLHTRSWSTSLLEIAGLDFELLPRLAAAGTRVGKLPPAMARRWHLPPEVTVVLGGHDQACAVLGCGASEPGMAMNAMGEVESLAATLEMPVLTPAMLDNHYACYPHVIPNRYLTLAYNFAGGSLLRWFRDTLGEAERSEAEERGLPFTDILLAKAGREPSPILILPYFATAGTPWMDPHARGAIIGLTVTTPKAHIVKALFDSLAYDLRLNLERLAEAGVDIHTLRVIGSGAQSATWLTLKANILDRVVVGVPITDAPALGAAQLAGMATGIYRDLEEAVALTICVGHRAEATPAEVARYTHPFRIYQQLYPALREVLHEL